MNLERKNKYIIYIELEDKALEDYKADSYLLYTKGELTKEIGRALGPGELYLNIKKLEVKEVK